MRVGPISFLVRGKPSLPARTQQQSLFHLSRVKDLLKAPVLTPLRWSLFLFDTLIGTGHYAGIGIREDKMVAAEQLSREVSRVLLLRNDYEQLRGMKTVIVEPQIAMMTASLERAMLASDDAARLLSIQELEGFAG